MFDKLIYSHLAHNEKRRFKISSSWLSFNAQLSGTLIVFDFLPLSLPYKVAYRTLNSRDRDLLPKFDLRKANVGGLYLSQRLAGAKCRPTAAPRNSGDLRAGQDSFIREQEKLRLTAWKVVKFEAKVYLVWLRERLCSRTP
ncbi:predicted protein [Histoplasma mississippiense (nom. inval.)]|uniref:predicted protein n=1 Tax=Ajellomyces capsulatus (strain NAm1 / WU24) TaxID=2059318 RepID=UPI000157BEE7|nr:predicted protein [Histoplasma mississippiense (nom. inval.)]EDN06963.1 predicted protein [Histoplasma mississippiense (nom. inval.)]